MADTELRLLTAILANAVAKGDKLPISDVSVPQSKNITIEELITFINGFHFVRAASSRTLTSTTSAQAIFQTANDTLTLTTGVWEFEGILSLSSMSATSGNAQFQLAGTGSTATISNILYDIVGIDGATATAATRTGSTSTTSSSAASAVSAGTGTAMQMRIKGTFECTVAGTIIPMIALVTAAAAVLAAGSYLKFRRIGGTGFTFGGDWG